MKIEVCRTAGEVARRGAALVAAALARNPCEVMALPTGRTPVAMYAELAAKRKAGSVDFSCATVFNLDEVLLPNPNPHTFFQFMRRQWQAVVRVRAGEAGRRLDRIEAVHMRLGIGDAALRNERSLRFAPDRAIAGGRDPRDKPLPRDRATPERWWCPFR